MIAVYGIISVVIVMVMVLQYLKSRAGENGDVTVTATGLQSRWAGLQTGRRAIAAAPGAANAIKDIVDAKEIIMARSQRCVYGLDGEETNVDDSRWAHELMSSWCEELDGRVADVLSLETIVNGFCERVENMVEEYLANLRQYHKQLAVITEACDSVEQEISKAVAERRFTVNDYIRHDVEPVSPDQSSARCMVTATSQDDLLSIYEQFVDEIQGTYS